MKVVRVKGIGVQVKGKNYFKNKVFQISDEDYEEIKEYVDTIKEIKENTYTELEKKNKSVDGSDINVGANKEITEEKHKEESKEVTGDKNSNNTKENARENEEENESEDEELEALREKAKKLGINITNNMKKETIIKKIEEFEEKEPKTGENQNPEGE